MNDTKEIFHKVDIIESSNNGAVNSQKDKRRPNNTNSIEKQRLENEDKEAARQATITREKNKENFLRFKWGMVVVIILMVMIFFSYVMDFALLINGFPEGLGSNIASILVPILTAMMGFLFSEYNKR